MNKIIAIAIDEYVDGAIGNLRNCSRDINSLINVLSDKYQFDSIELFNRPEQTTLSFLYEQLYNELINSLESDSILILYAGHGEFNSLLGTSYWLCSDSRKSNVTTWFNVGDLLKFFNASSAKHIAIISDSCFSGAIFEMNRGGGLIALEGKKSRQALTSGGVEKVSDGLENSPFTVALLEVLTENTSEAFSFSQLSENTIIRFDASRKQTPVSGALASSGDSGGSFFFKLKKDNAGFIKSVKIPLEINQDIKIESTFEIPFFNENKYFNHSYINAFVQQLGYSIINDVRVFVTGDEQYSIARSSEMGFSLEVGYSIQTLNEKFLSIIINRDDYFGGAHPNHTIYCLNFAFNPERKLSLYDILDYSGFSNMENFLFEMIDRYAEADCKEILKQYSTYEYISDLEFTFDDKTFSVCYMNLFPHAFKACGFVEIPIGNVKFKI